MPDIFYLLSKWRKPILALFLISVAAAAVTVFLLPRRYLSTTTSLPASSYSADRSRIFNQNIQSLYSDMGTTDELDRIIGTAKLDTVFLAVTDQFNLYDHYKVTKSHNVRQCAAELLKKHSRIIKSDYGELKVKVWDTDKHLAPQLANAITTSLDGIHRNLQNAINKAALTGLQQAQQKILARLDSNDKSSPTNKSEEDRRSFRHTALNLQLQENEKLLNEYELMLGNKSPVLLIVENAKAADKPDKPRKLQVILSAAVLSLLFGLLLALVLEKRKPAQV